MATMFSKLSLFSLCRRSVLFLRLALFQLEVIFITMSTSIEDLKSFFDKKFDEIAAKVSAPKVQVKSITLKRTSNQDQLDHAQDLLINVKSARLALSEGKQESAETFLERSEVAITKRIKLIRLADKSPNGWETVRCYESDTLADDSDDDKRIKKAEADASRKRKIREDSLANYKKTRTDAVPSTSYHNKQFFRVQDRPRTFKYEDRCFSCGRQGHWRVHCPQQKQRLPETNPDRKPFA